MNAWSIALVNYAACFALALAMDRHREDITGGRPLGPRLRWAARVAGVLLMLLAWRAGTLAWGSGVGSAAWLGLLGFAAMAQGATLTWAARRAPATAVAALLLAGVIASLTP